MPLEARGIHLDEKKVMGEGDPTLCNIGFIGIQEYPNIFLIIPYSHY